MQNKFHCELFVIVVVDRILDYGFYYENLTALKQMVR